MSDKTDPAAHIQAYLDAWEATDYLREMDEITGQIGDVPGLTVPGLRAAVAELKQLRVVTAREATGVMTTPYPERFEQIRTHYDEFGFSGPTDLDRERDQIIGFLIGEVLGLRDQPAELEQLRTEHRILLDGNQRLQVMNNGLRQLAIEAREAADGWHRATVDLYSGRVEPHPVGCECEWPEADVIPQQPETEPEPCDGDCDCDCQPGQPCLCPERDCYCGPCRVCDRDEAKPAEEDGRG